MKFCSIVWAAFVLGSAFAGDGFIERVVRGEATAPVSVTTNAAGNLLVDFGRHAAGWIEVDAASPGPYTFIWGEMIDAKGSIQTNAFFTRQKGTLRCACTHDSFVGTGWTRVPYKTGSGGVFRSEAVGPFGTVMPFRWLEVVRTPFPITARNVRQVPIHYPYDMSEESFACDLPELVRVHDFCKHTIRATTYMGKFIDGDRERLPYEADSYVTQLGTYAITSDHTLVRAMADYFATHTTWPTEWKQFFIRIVHDDWMYSGKTDLVRKHYGLMKDVKAWRNLRRADGLVVSFGDTIRDVPGIGRVCDIVDWGKCYRDGFVFTEVNAVVNALHYRNLRELAEMARAIGKNDDAEMFEAEAEQTFAAYQRVLFDPAAGRYRDGIGTGHATVQGNAMALACGVVPPERMASVAEYVASKGFTCSTYMAQFVLDALFAGGRADEAIRLMTSSQHRSWLGMMAKGATITMEFWDLVLDEPGRVPDMNHAWSTAPLNMISRRVLGVTPREPGFAEIAIRPQPGPLKRLSGTVPTVRGSVRLEMAREGNRWRVSLETPAPTTFEFAGCRKRVEAGRYSWEIPAGAVLPPGNWHEPVRAALQRAIDRRAGDPDAYAVFDFDNTCAIGDCEHAVVGYIIDNLLFAFSPDEAPAIFLDGVPDPDRPLEPGKPAATTRNVVLDCADLHRELLALAARQPLAEVRKTDAFAALASKVRYLRKRMSRTFGSGFGYPWNKRFYSRMTVAQFRDVMHAALDAAVADGRFVRGVWRTPASRPGRAGCVEVPMFLGFVVPQEVKDLVRALKESGIAVYIVSGSFFDAVVPGADGRYGVAFPEENIFGIHMKTDAQGRLTGMVDERFPVPWADGKPDVIRQQIATKHHGRGPMLVAGDANGDYAMLTAFQDMDAGLVFDTRPDAESPLGTLIAAVRAGTAQKRYLVQGRDEAAGGLRMSDESILVPSTDFESTNQNKQGEMR